ncbi:MAG: hypothetical protein AB9891_02940 [Anaerolineaceae bacterium]
MEEKKACVFCGVGSNELPLLVMTYFEKDYYICPEHVPVLIHEPAKLTGKLPGAEKLTGHAHD